MKAYYFIYTRNKDIDYRSFFSPNEEFCPKETRKIFLSQARGLINVDTYDDPLDEPRWLYSRIGKFILFGLGINNYDLNNEFYTDFAGRPIRGFFGLIIEDDGSQIKLPYSLDFYKDTYKSLIVPIWNVEQGNLSKQSVELEHELDSYDCIIASGSNLTLNCDRNKTTILGDIDAKLAFSSALSQKTDLSIVVGFNNKYHAYAHEYAYYNAIVRGVSIREEKTHKQQISITPKPPVHIKKALRPKQLMGIITISMIVMILISIFLALRGCNTKENKTPNQKELVSGAE